MKNVKSLSMTILPEYSKDQTIVSKIIIMGQFLTDSSAIKITKKKAWSIDFMIMFL